MKVLIVDDNFVAADLLAELLEDVHSVRTTYSARQALQAANETAFDVALIDLNLPDLPGATLADQLRHSYPSMVLVAITASSLPEIRKHAGSTPIFLHILQKPMNFDELAKILAKLDRQAT